MTVIALKRPTAAQIDRLKADLKQAGIPYSVRIQKNIKGSYGTVSVTPRKHGDRRNWTREQTLQVIEIARRNGFFVEDYERNGTNNNGLVYSGGLSYLWAIA